jgi:hypothetical protein
VEVLLSPGEILASFFAGAPMAAGRFTSNGPDELVGMRGRDRYLGIGRGGQACPGQINSSHQNEFLPAKPAFRFGIRRNNLAQLTWLGTAFHSCTRENSSMKKHRSLSLHGRRKEVDHAKRG